MIQTADSRGQRFAQRKAELSAEHARRLAASDEQFLADVAANQQAFAASAGAAEPGSHPGSALAYAPDTRLALDIKRAADSEAATRRDRTRAKLDTELAQALSDCYSEATQGAVDSLACAYATACAEIDAAIERLRAALRQAEAESGEQLDRQLATAAGVVALANYPGGLGSLVNPQAWVGTGFSNGGLYHLGAELAHALRDQDTPVLVAVLGRFRTELAAVTNGKWPPLPEAMALPRWEVRRACLPLQAEQAKLAELERAEQRAARDQADAATPTFVLVVPPGPVDLVMGKDPNRHKRFSLTRAKDPESWRMVAETILGGFDLSVYEHREAMRRELDRVAAIHAEFGATLREMAFLDSRLREGR